MIPDIAFDTSTSMLKFNSTADLRQYLKHLLDSNLQELDKVSDTTALFMRDSRVDPNDPNVKGWVKSGPVFVNKLDPERATLDILFALVREIKPRIAQIQEALKTAEKLESLGIHDEDAVLLYVKLGLPERFVVIKSDAPEPREKFELKATYSTV